MFLFNSVKERFSKVAHAASEQIFNEFPNCDDLLNTNKLSIKLDIDYETLNNRNQQLARQGRFTNIPFLIRNEERQKITLMMASVEAENGIFITTNDGNAIMYVRPPNQTPNCLGKLMHTNPTATMFKIMQQSDPQKFLVHSISSNTPILKIEKLNNFKGKCFTFLGADCVHCFKKMDNTVVGNIRPKMCHSSNTLIVQFNRTNTDIQIRAIILGIASLFAITEAYPEIGEMLSQTLQRHR